MPTGSTRQDHRRGPGVERLVQTRMREGFYDRYLSGKAVLDIGFRGGVADALPVVDHAIGVELDYPSYDGTHLPFPALSQDAVFASHCLEHIANYRDVLSEWYRVLKVGGYLIIVVPHRHLYERKATLPSRFNPDHKRFYSSASVLAEVEESLPVAGFRIRSLREIDYGFDYALSPNEHAIGCYDIELVIQKLEVPSWAAALTLAPEGRERFAIEHYGRLLLSYSRQPLAIALDAARRECRAAAKVPLPPFATLLERVRGELSDTEVLRELLKIFVAANPFDQVFYVNHYSDLTKASDSGRLPDPRRHFVYCGYFEGRFGYPDDPWLV